MGFLKAKSLLSGFPKGHWNLDCKLYQPLGNWAGIKCAPKDHLAGFPLTKLPSVARDSFINRLQDLESYFYHSDSRSSDGPVQAVVLFGEEKQDNAIFHQRILNTSFKNMQLENTNI